MVIKAEKQAALKTRMVELELLEEDLVEQFILSQGRGGQKLQKTASCVRLKHLPSGIQVKCQRERSREDNRFLARRELCDRYEEEILGRETKRQKEDEKRRKRKKRRQRRYKAKTESKSTDE